MRRIYWALALGVFIAAGCASDYAHSKFILLGSPLDAEVARQTRTAKLYRQLDTLMIADVIYNGRALRTAWAEQKAKSARLGEEQASGLLAGQMERNGEYAQFYVALYTPDSEWNDLDKPQPHWTVLLETESGAVNPVSIEKVKRDSVPWAGSLPFYPNFRTFYKVDFPRRLAGSGPLKLALTSLQGETRLVWDGD